MSTRWCRVAEGQTLSSYKYDDETAGPWLGSPVLTKTPGKGGKGPKMDPIVIDTAVTVALQLAQVSRYTWLSSIAATVALQLAQVSLNLTVQCLCCPSAMSQQPTRFTRGTLRQLQPLSCSWLRWALPDVLLAPYAMG